MARHRRLYRNPTSAGRRAIVPPAPASQANYSWFVPVAVGLGAGILAWFFTRPKTAAAATPGASAVPGTTTTSFPAPPVSGYSQANGQSSSIGSTSGPNGPDPSPALVARLRGDDNARQVFGFQAEAYSNGATEAVPDGIDGQVTDALVSVMTRGQSSTFGPSVLANARAYIDSLGSTFSVRLLPFTLPQDVIDAVNASVQSVDPGAGPLQVLATIGPSGASPLPAAQARLSQIRAAGQARPGSRSMQRSTSHAPARPASQAVIPYAGFDRPIEPTPMNYVGSNPGYGAMIDPRGLNIGLWNALEGPMHAPQPTGNVALDNDQNPIAGQRGGFWQGYR